MTNETIVQDWEPETSSKLSLIIDDTIITTGNLKIKCVVDSFGLYHKSNEVSIETFGLKPTPKSVQMQPQTASEVIEEIEVQSKSGTLRKLNLFLSNLLLLLIAAVQWNCDNNDNEKYTSEVWKITSLYNRREPSKDIIEHDFTALLNYKTCDQLELQTDNDNGLCLQTKLSPYPKWKKKLLET